jgi:quinohemoprotein ethanol dehydrogenase
VMAGWGGSLAAGARNDSNGPSHLLVFKLGAHGQLAPVPAYDPPPIDPPAQTETAAVIDKGAAIYGRLCVRCHGGNAAGGGLGLAGPADLRRTPFLQDQAAFDQVVMDGALLDRGMAPFKAEVDADKAKAIRAYIIYAATQAKKNGAK